MSEWIQNLLTFGSAVGLISGLLVKQIKATNATNTKLDKLNDNMEHRFIVLQKDINNNFAIVDDNMAIFNGELVSLKRVVFETDKDDPLPIRKTDKI